MGKLRWEQEHYRKQGNTEAAEAFRKRYFRRMWDLSQFMKTLKQRFTSWFNRRHERRGTLWEVRFKSVLVESGHAARTMAAYIDLNPVRAGGGRSEGLPMVLLRGSGGKGGTLT